MKGISRKIVRLKKYEDGVYKSEEYQHFVVIHVRQPQGGSAKDIAIELNEFQVQMAIDKLTTYELGKELYGSLSVNENKENTNDKRISRWNILPYLIPRQIGIMK